MVCFSKQFHSHLEGKHVSLNSLTSMRFTFHEYEGQMLYHYPEVYSFTILGPTIYLSSLQLLLSWGHIFSFFYHLQSEKNFRNFIFDFWKTWIFQHGVHFEKGLVGWLLNLNFFRGI